MPAILPTGIGPCCRGTCTTVSIDQLIEDAIAKLIDPFLVGHGSPEGVRIGVIQGQLYTDLDTGAKYTFIGTVGQTIGWV